MLYYYRSTKSAQQMRPFWERRNYWYPTWNVERDSRDMQIDYIRVYDFDPTDTAQWHWYNGGSAAPVSNFLYNGQ